MRAITLEEYKDRVETVHKNRIRVISFTHTKGEATFYCTTHKVEYKASASGNGGTGCSICRKESFTKAKNAIYIAKHKALLRKHYGDSIKFDAKSYVSSKLHKARYKCSEHGIFWQYPCYVDMNEYACPECYATYHKSGEATSLRTQKELKKALAKSCYSLVGPYEGAYTQIRATCSKHPETSFTITPSTFIAAYKYNNSRHFNCPSCLLDLRSEKQYTHKDVASYVKEVNPDIRFRTKYTGCKNPVDLHCTVCKRDWTVKCSETLMRGVGCPTCNYGVPVSKGEQEMFNFIKSLCPTALQSQRVLRNVDTGSMMELDVYIPELKVAFEYNGLHWHSDRHISNTRHWVKYVSGLEQGIRVINIYEDEWHLNKDVIKKFVSNILTPSSSTIYARKCTIKRTTTYLNAIKDFFKSNHVQGAPNQFDVAYGLFYMDELVACMTFSNNTRSKGSDVELTRFATSKHVVGGASRLFSRYLTDNPEVRSVVSFSDNEKFTGNMYEKMGFTLDRIIKPDYTVVLNRRRRHKSNTRLTLLAKRLGDRFNPNLTERENCQNNGIGRIFDSGKKRWVYESQ